MRYRTWTINEILDRLRYALAYHLSRGEVPRLIRVARPIAEELRARLHRPIEANTTYELGRIYGVRAVVGEMMTSFFRVEV